MIGPDLYSFGVLWRHYRQCRRNKRTIVNALAFEVNAEANLLALQQQYTQCGREERSVLACGGRMRQAASNDCSRPWRRMPGACDHGATQYVWRAIWEQYLWLNALFTRRDWVLTERWSRRHAGNDCLIFFPMGRFIEFYGPQRLLATTGVRAALHAAAARRLCVYRGVSDAVGRLVPGEGASAGHESGRGQATIT